MYKLMTVNGLPVVIGIAVCLGVGSAQGGNPAYFSVYPSNPGSVWYDPPPSYFGYHLDEFAAGYYGGGRYREYYGYGRGVGLADYPGPFAWPGVPPDYRGPRKRVRVDEVGPLPADMLPGPPPGRTCVSLTVQAPADAEIWLDGVKTNQTGPARRFESPALQPGGVYTYEVKACWTEQGRNVEQSQIILVHAGDEVRVNFPAVPELEQQTAPQRFPLAAGQAGRLPPTEERGFPRNP
jgi:uncharacterized protein (TIGR03000 family)